MSVVSLVLGQLNDVFEFVGSLLLGMLVFNDLTYVSGSHDTKSTYLGISSEALTSV